jgi:hypothetical protein
VDGQDDSVAADTKRERVVDSTGDLDQHQAHGDLHGESLETRQGGNDKRRYRLANRAIAGPVSLNMVHSSIDCAPSFW